MSVPVVIPSAICLCLCLGGQQTESGTDLVALPRRVVAPKTNPTTPEKVALGKKLFFDPRLSGNNEISCATCHMPKKAWADGRRFSPGAGGRLLTRNTQSCLNVGFFKSFFWDGRATSLEDQSLAPILSPAEMDQDLEELESELRAVPAYVTEFRRAFGLPPTRQGVARALAAYQRTLIAAPSPFDRFLAGEEDALSEGAKRGLELFRGDAGCSRCHHGPLLSDGKFYRLGLNSKDVGREQVTGKKSDRYRVRTPSLRNVAQTAPYMHNGSLATLEDVVTFYYRGIPDAGPGGVELDAAALTDRSFSEIGPLVEFLESLTGPLPDLTPPQLPADDAE